MYNKEVKSFIIGEEISLDEISKFAKIDRSCNFRRCRHLLKRNEVLLLRYCNALDFALNFIPNKETKSWVAEMPNTDKKKLIVDTLIYSMNMNAIQSNSSNKLLISHDRIPLVDENYLTSVVELVYLQAGYRVKEVSDEKHEYLVPNKVYHLEKCEPVSLRELADSLNEYINTYYSEDEDEKE